MVYFCGVRRAGLFLCLPVRNSLVPMEMAVYAIIKTGGKQYRVTEGYTLAVEKLEGEPDTSIEITEVLMVNDDETVKVGAPFVEGAKVTATIVSQGKNAKINGFTYKPKKNEHRRYGHRQKHTKIKIVSIQV
jgi:large subunit ribosomal protein L21